MGGRRKRDNGGHLTADPITLMGVRPNAEQNLAKIVQLQQHRLRRRRRRRQHRRRRRRRLFFLTRAKMSLSDLIEEREKAWLSTIKQLIHFCRHQQTKNIDQQKKKWKCRKQVFFCRENQVKQIIWGKQKN